MRDGYRFASRKSIKATVGEFPENKDAPMTDTTANLFDSSSILDGIRRWVEIETPTEAPEQVNKLATMVVEGYRDLPATIERVAGHFGCGDHILARSSWGQDAPGILVLSHLDTVHPLGFI